MILPTTFIKQTIDELKKIIWPSRQEVIRLTGVIIIVSLIVGMFMGGIDLLFTKALESMIQ